MMVTAMDKLRGIPMRQQMMYPTIKKVSMSMGLNTSPNSVKTISSRSVLLPKFILVGNDCFLVGIDNSRFFTVCDENLMR
jgi:hypothetical protein